MNAIKITQTVEPQLADALPKLRPLIGKKVEITVVETEPDEKPRVRRAGFLKGKLWMSDDFDAPLEDFKEYM